LERKWLFAATFNFSCEVGFIPSQWFLRGSDSEARGQSLVLQCRNTHLATVCI
jgi:hypothetical protein